MAFSHKNDGTRCRKICFLCVCLSFQGVETLLRYPLCTHVIADGYHGDSIDFRNKFLSFNLNVIAASWTKLFAFKHPGLRRMFSRIILALFLLYWRVQLNCTTKNRKKFQNSAFFVYFSKSQNRSQWETSC